MMDEIDLAQENDEFYRQQALREHYRRANIGDALPQDAANILCLDCGEEIGAARMKANPAAVRCVDCQEKIERHGRAGYGEPGPGTAR